MPKDQRRQIPKRQVWRVKENFQTASKPLVSISEIVTLKCPQMNASKICSACLLATVTCLATQCWSHYPCYIQNTGDTELVVHISHPVSSSYYVLHDSVSFARNLKCIRYEAVIDQRTPVHWINDSVLQFTLPGQSVAFLGFVSKDWEEDDSTLSNLTVYDAAQNQVLLDTRNTRLKELDGLRLRREMLIGVQYILLKLGD